ALLPAAPRLPKDPQAGISAHVRASASRHRPGLLLLRGTAILVCKPASEPGFLCSGNLVTPPATSSPDQSAPPASPPDPPLPAPPQESPPPEAQSSQDPPLSLHTAASPHNAPPPSPARAPRSP